MSAIPKSGKGPTQSILPPAESLVGEGSFDAARNWFPTSAQPDVHTASWGVNSFAVLSVRAGSGNPQDGEQIGHRIPGLRGLKSSRVTGIRLAVADRGVTLTALGLLRDWRYDSVANGEGRDAPPVTKNCTTLSDMSVWKFGQRRKGPDAMDTLGEGALRLSGQDGSEAGFNCCGSRAAAERPHGSVSKPDLSS